jgi:transposase
MDASRAQGASRRPENEHFGLSYKRLEAGTFTFVERLRSDAKSVEIDTHELSMLLEGIDVQRARIAPRWEPPFDTRSAQQ